MNKAKTILVPVDFSDSSRAAIERALVLAEACGCEVRLLHVLALPLVLREYSWAGLICSELRASEMTKLDALRKEFDGRGPTLSTCFEEGDPPQVIHDAARAANVGLVVMGSHGRRGLDRTLLGRIADRTLRRSPSPVLIVREDLALAAKTPRSILLATDFSQSAQRAEPIVLDWARKLRAEVEVFHVVPDTTMLFVPYAVPESRIFDEELLESATRRLDGVAERFRREGVAVKSGIAVGYASREIVRRAESTGAQIIALGSRGHGRIRRFAMGSVVQNVLLDASCSVLVGVEGSQHEDPQHT